MYEKKLYFTGNNALVIEGKGNKKVKKESKCKSLMQ